MNVAKHCLLFEIVLYCRKQKTQARGVRDCSSTQSGVFMEYLIIGAIAAAIVALIVIIIVVAVNKIDFGGFTFEPPQRAAGRRGEQAAAAHIRSVLCEGDALFNNVSVSYDGRPAELDNVIVNKYGVFIIEVKNYSGRLYGSEDDYEWNKVHVSGAGNSYLKTVKNPIKQVKREIYILAKYLEYYGVSVWVDGYAMILGASSPVKSDLVLSSLSDIDRAIHTPGKKMLNTETVNEVKKLLA